MGKIKLLDCTLTEGGSVCDWSFGEKAIEELIDGMLSCGAEIIGVGVLKDEKYNTERAVFNSMSQALRLVDPNRLGVRYMVEIENTKDLPLNYFEKADEATASILICVNVNKNLLEAELEYCRELQDKGYTICIRPVRTNQYSTAAFQTLINCCNDLKPAVLYMDDSFGTEDQDSLKPYLELADDQLNTAIAVGFHGCDNLGMAFDTARAFAEMPLRHDLVIDAGIAGIGSGAGTIKLEQWIRYATRNLSKEYSCAHIPHLYDRYLQKKDLDHAAGRAISSFLSAVNGCSPQYAEFMTRYLYAGSEELVKILPGISEEDNVHFSKDKAIEYTENARKTYFEKKLAIIIPTANRHQSIDYGIKTLAPQAQYWGIDVYIYDSSSDDRTESEVKKYLEEETILDGKKARKYNRVHYVRYTGPFDGVSLDEKFITICEDLAAEYEYLWICRDGLIPTPSQFPFDLQKMLQKEYDMIVLNWLGADEIGCEFKEYQDCAEFFADNCRQMVILGTTIFRSGFLARVVREIPIDKQKNYSLWMPISMFQYIADHDFSAAYYVGDMSATNVHGTPSSLWNKNGGALWQWGEHWYEMISSLPNVYDSQKPKVLKIQTPTFHPFSITALFIMRCNGSLTYETYRKNQTILPYVTDYSLERFWLISRVPKWVCKLVLKHKDGLIGKIGRKLYHLRRNPTKDQRNLLNPPLSEMRASVMNVDQDIAKFEPKKLCVIIPTANRADILADVLDACLDQYRAHGIDVIVYDSSKDNCTQTLVQSMNNKGFDNLFYNRFTGTDTTSLDDKVMSAYKLYCGKYEYVWVIRDRLVIQLNKCAYEIRKSIRRDVDLISIHNLEDELSPIGYKTYTGASDLFREQFIYLTVLGQLIVRSETILKILDEIPLDAEKNYSLWQPIAFFEYFSFREFVADSITEKSLFLFHPTVLQGSFWMKSLLWQWVDRFYSMMKLLPDTYDEVKDQVIADEEVKYGLLTVPYLLGVRSKGGMKYSEVKALQEKIPYVTKTPVRQFYAIALMPRFLAKAVLNHPNSIFIRAAKKIWHMMQRHQ